ncbi:DUF4862 family protein [Gryllotalpicola reticulitermitis]|uniref:DUF4862 family protein n=1 Tax=Gryllotalpicola reticulitermitis TaxID=1184153 RepID=A0ABV8Q9H9_9MICO
MTDGIVLGAYVLHQEDFETPDEEAEWYRLLAGVDGAGGLEIPLRGGRLHPEGPRRVAELLPAGWKVVITVLPAALAALRTAPGYGLASVDSEGRAAAIADVRAALDEAAQLAGLLGRPVVSALHVTSAPRGGGSGPLRVEALTTSLAELGDEAGSIGLFVEHCDSWHDDRRCEKGFLALGDEIAAITAAQERTDASLGQVVNWGRSAIDERSVDGARRHLDALLGAGTLRGVVLSGASASGGALGGAWTDVHNPIDTADPSSLLTESEVALALTREVVAASAHIGVKVQDPARSADLDAHLEPLRATVASVRRAVAGVTA